MPLFISHSSTDRRVAEQIVTRLRAEGFASLFLDIDPVQGIPAGRNWERELYAALRRTDGVIFLASRTSVSSPWCFAEVSLARSLDRPVFPVHLEDTPRLALLSDVQWVNLTDREVGFASLLAGLRRAGLSAGDAFPWDPFRPPYPGLEPFSSEDAAVFFGRDGEISRLLELLHPTLQRGPGRFVAIVGPSGSGKSSLLRAGLLPRLQRLGGRWVLLPPLRPGEQPTRNLARCLVEAFVGLGQPRALKDVDQYLHRGSVGLIELALELAELTAEPGARQPAVLIVIDQAEELLTRTGPREQQAFLQLLVEALGEESPLWAVATVRSEFLSTAPERAGLADAVDDPLVVEPLSRARLPDVIGRPGQRAGLTFEPGLVERMVEDTAGGDALPLLAFSLRELYDHSHTAEGNIRFADYEALGGVLGALEQQADRLLDELTRRGRGPLILPTLLKLVSVGHEGEAIRRRVFRSSLSADEQLVVDAFIDARLLTSDSGGGGDVSVEVAHEALLRQWSPLRQAIEDSRRSLQMRSELDRLATDWDRRETGKGRSYEESYLLHGGRLDDFRKWANDHPDEMDPIKLEYLRVSRALHDRRLRQLRGLSAGLAVLLIGALIAGTAAILQANKAQAAAHLAMSRQLAVVANQLVDRQPDVAVLVGLESLSAAQGETVLPAAGLITGLARMNNSSRLLEVSNRAYDASFSPDGELLATSGDNGMVQLWNADTGRPHGSPLSGHQGGVSRVEFSPDGRLLASAGDDGTVRLWDVASGQPSREPISAQAGMVYDVAFNRTGELLATSNQDGTVRLWDVATGQPHGQPLTGGAYGVTFSPDGQLIASGSSDNEVRVWDVATGLPHGPPLTGHTGDVLDVAFSPDGKLLASASADDTLRIWEVSSGSPFGEPLSTHEGDLADDAMTVSFSPDGEFLASGWAAGTVVLWDVASGRQHGQALAGHTGTVNAVEFRRGGDEIASASDDGTVRLWKTTPTFTVGRPLIGHAGPLVGIAFSPDQTLLASASADRTVRLWNVGSGQLHSELAVTSEPRGVSAVAFRRDGKLLATDDQAGVLRFWDPASGQPVGEPLQGAPRVFGLAFSPDGALIAAGAGDGTVRIWNVASRQPHGPPLTGHTDWVYNVAFSPDGKLLASAGADGTVRLWNVDSGRQHGQPLTGHIGAIYDVAFSPDGKLLASAGADGTVRLWNVDSGRQHGHPLTGHANAVYGVAFSPNGRLLASGGDDRTVRLWNVDSGRQQGQSITGHTDSVRRVTFSSDGELLASSSDDGTIQLWNTDLISWSSKTWAEHGCRMVNRNLSAAEWKQLIEGFSYERTCPQLPAGPGAPSNARPAAY